MALPRVGVIGAGYWGKNLLRNFSALGALTAFCDSDPTIVEAQAKIYPDAQKYEDVDRFLAQSEIDAVSIATPSATHGTLTRRALDAGKHVLVEKPFCLEVAEAHSLDALAREKNLTLMVGHLLLYHPAFLALQRFVDDGRLGELRYIYSNRASLGKIRREENALWSFAPHDISMILKLIGSVPRRVVCSGGSWLNPPIADTSLTHLTFTGGAQAHIFVSWLHPYKDHRLVVVGSDSMAVFNDSETGPQKLMHYPHEVSWEKTVPTVNRAEARPIAYEAGEPLALECAHFLDCVATDGKPLTDAQEAIQVLSVLNACQRSLVGGDAVEMGDG